MNQITKPILAVPTDEGRMYVHPLTGECVYSVTTAISGGIPKKLENWSAKMAAEYAVDNWDELSLTGAETKLSLISTAHERVRDKAAGKGDVVHNSVENYNNGTPDDNSPKHMKQFENFLEVSGFTPIFQEVTVWNRAHGYAGTADCIARNRKGRYVMLDYKTGKNVWPEAALQLAALSSCEFILDAEGNETPMPLILEQGVLHLRPLSWNYHRVDEWGWKGNFAAFLGAKAVADWRRLHPAMVWGRDSKMNASSWREAA